MIQRTLLVGFLSLAFLGSIGCCCTERCVARPTIVGSAPVCCPNPCNSCNKIGGTVIVPSTSNSGVIAGAPPGAITHH